MTTVDWPNAKSSKKCETSSEAGEMKSRIQVTKFSSQVKNL